MRVLVVDESGKHADIIRQSLQRAGHEPVPGSSASLLEAVAGLKPDVIVIASGSPACGLLEQLEALSRPVVMFASDGTRKTIREAVKAGVSAYVVDGLDAGRLCTIIDVAVARFEDFQRLRAELADAQLRLSERKVIERAKGVLMKRHGLDEEAAYAFLRKAAMDRKQRLAEVAARLLGA